MDNFEVKDIISNHDDAITDCADVRIKTDDTMAETGVIKAETSCLTAAISVATVGNMDKHESTSSSESADATPTRRNKRKMAEPRRRTTDFSIRSICQNSDSEEDNESNGKDDRKVDDSKKVKISSIKVENSKDDSQSHTSRVTTDIANENSTAPMIGYPFGSFKSENLSNSNANSLVNSLGFGSPTNCQNFMPLLYATGSVPSLWLYGSPLLSRNPLMYPFPIPSPISSHKSEELNHSVSSIMERIGETNKTSSTSCRSPPSRIQHPSINNGVDLSTTVTLNSPNALQYSKNHSHANLSNASIATSSIPLQCSNNNSSVNLSNTATSSLLQQHSLINVSKSSLASLPRTEEHTQNSNSSLSSPRMPQQLNLSNTSSAQRPQQHSQILNTPQIESNPTFSPPSSPTSTADDASSMASHGRSRKNYKNMTKQRRIEANARERTRVHTISAAFENLRRAVPSYSCNQRLSKLAILKIACSYILALANLAELDYSEDNCSMTFDDCVDLCNSTIQAEGKAKRKH